MSRSRSSILLVLIFAIFSAAFAQPARAEDADETRLISRKDLLLKYVPGSAAALKAEMSKKFKGDRRLPALLTEIDDLRKLWATGAAGELQIIDELLTAIDIPAAKPVYEKPEPEEEAIDGKTYVARRVSFPAMMQKWFTVERVPLVPTKGYNAACVVATTFAIGMTVAGHADLDEATIKKLMDERHTLGEQLGFIAKDRVTVMSAHGNARLFGARLIFTKTPFPASAEGRRKVLQKIRDAIDAGRPVSLRVPDHSMLIVGYRHPGTLEDEESGKVFKEADYKYELHDVGYQNGRIMDHTGQVYTVDNVPTLARVMESIFTYEDWTPPYEAEEHL